MALNISHHTKSYNTLPITGNPRTQVHVSHSVSRIAYAETICRQVGACPVIRSKIMIIICCHFRKSDPLAYWAQ